MVIEDKPETGVDDKWGCFQINERSQPKGSPTISAKIDRAANIVIDKVSYTASIHSLSRCFGKNYDLTVV